MMQIKATQFKYSIFLFGPDNIHFLLIQNYYFGIILQIIILSLILGFITDKLETTK